MKRTSDRQRRKDDIVFLPALTPLEAAMLPARERPITGALRHAMRETERRFFPEEEETPRAQRTKIWVR